MNAKSVLNRIATLLMSEEVKFTDARTADGTILQSPTFDLGESVEVIDADGKKTPAPDGEHEIALKDSEGNEVVIRIVTKDGKITERENVEEKNPEVEDEEEMNKSMDEEVVDKKAAVEEHMADVTTEEAKALPNTTDEDPRNRVGSDADDKKDPIISLSYRIEELENKMKDMMEKFTSAFPSEGQEVSSLIPSGENMAAVDPDEEEEELPKLDGAPLEPFAKEQNSKNYGKKSADYQSSFLSKLYR